MSLNTHVQFGPYLFHQKIGIPVGDNCAPFLADLFLSWLEYKFMINLTKNVKKLARLLSNNSRYLDDILIINLKGFGKTATKIYPKELILENTNVSDTHDTFLDLDITIINDKFNVGIYNKTDHFNFEITSFTFPESNIHSQIGYNTFYSQLFRFYQLCSNLNNFEIRAQLVFKKLISRGYLLLQLSKRYKKILNKKQYKLWINMAKHQTVNLFLS